ncbi:hypothetical protein EJ06DRAFT_554668 [Trichodelitschia bisporula]|uniref:Uncharacterized protein n=1 Tax=Trichodelitschia bisporula TaxID=703511 RepID=A0A6G1I4B5_9PEZI|nr:hypothetical protein EJ06DRAFT_554668 [Trichodelitschia bisporula]
MNTVRSVGYGWLVLIAAGGGAYVFAKRSINAERAAKSARDRELAARQQALRDAEYGARHPGSVKESAEGPLAALGARRSQNGHAVSDFTGEPSREASSDPAPTRHAPETQAEQEREKSKYEASEVWRSRKGDRLS